jgi:hypothetical protein
MSRRVHCVFACGDVFGFACVFVVCFGLILFCFLRDK